MQNKQCKMQNAEMPGQFPEASPVLLSGVTPIPFGAR
jgi:hypothetical protein